jgi:hypothetical protein
MLAKLAITLAAFIGMSVAAFGQSIPRNDQPRYTVEGYTGKRTGTVMMEFGVSMADCIARVEVENLKNHKKYIMKLTIDDYHVRDNDMEEIFAKVRVGKFKKLVDKKEGLASIVTVIRKDGKVMFKGPANMILNDEEGEEPKDKATALK